MNWRLLVLAGSIVLAASAAVVVFAGPGSPPAEITPVVTDDADGPADAELSTDTSDVDANVLGLGSDDGAGLGTDGIAEVIADAFEADQGDVLELHDAGIGFGALFKLYALADAMNLSVEELLATLSTDGDGEFEFAFGELRRSLTDGQLATLEAGPKNLGSLVSESRHNGPGAGSPPEVTSADASSPGQDGESASKTKDHGQPEGVPRGNARGNGR